MTHHVQENRHGIVAQYIIENVPRGLLGETVGDIRARLESCRHADASHVFLLDRDGTWHGTVRIGDVLASPASTTAASLLEGAMDWSVSATTDREDAASMAIRSGASSIAVIGEGNRFLGTLDAAGLLSILRDEHLEDLHHMAGILSHTQTAREALTAAPWRRAAFRMPWLLVGMVCSALMAMMMSFHENELSANIAVAVFVPALIYLADAVGTQSEAVAVRALSVTSTPIWSLISGEVATGALMGSALGLIAFPVVYLMYGDGNLAGAVSLALLASSVTATGVGFLLPLAFDSISLDPAYGSGPLGTIVQDTLTLAVYLAFANVLVFG